MTFQESLGNSGLSHTIKYIAKLQDSGRRLTCRIFQTDDENNVIETKVSTLLKIQATPEVQVLGAGAIAGIASASLAFLIVLVIIIFLWVTGKGCFATPETRTIHVSSAKPNQGTMEVQTNDEIVKKKAHSVGVGAAFGPQKPDRMASKEDLTAPLLGKAAPESDPDVSKLEVILAVDELNAFDYEGDAMSKATSLSSLDTYVSEKDWDETLKSFGPKFSDLRDIFSGNYDDSSSVSSNEKGGGTEV